MKIEELEQKNISKEMLPEILDRIFMICKTDPNFPLKNKVEALEDTISRMDKKIAKQEKLLEQAETIKKDLVKKISYLDDKNFQLKSELLDILGSGI